MATRIRTPQKTYMTTEEFRDRIRKLLGAPNEITGAKRSHPCLVRKPTDKGYYPPTNK